MPTAPKAFLCHAHEDQARFVEPFAKELLRKGIDVFYSGWDIGPGDHLWERISQGLDDCDTFVLIASRTSLAKPWVKEEIGGGLTAKLADRKRFVVIVLEGCQDALPMLLRGRKYLTVPDVTDYAGALSELVNAMHGYTTKPPLGKAPEHVVADPPPSGLGLTAADWRVMSLLAQSTVDDIHGFVEDDSIILARTDSGLGDDSFVESLELLDELGYLKLSKAIGPGVVGGGIVHVRVTPSGFEEFLLATRPDYPVQKQRILAAVVNGGTTNATGLMTATDCPMRIVRHVAQWIDEQGLAKVRFDSRPEGHFLICLPTAQMRRMVAEGE